MNSDLQRGCRVWDNRTVNVMTGIYRQINGYDKGIEVLLM